MPELMPHSRVGPYTVVKLLRKGGMASIYLAAWWPTAEAEPVQVALKVANTASDFGAGRDQSLSDLQSFHDEGLSNEVEILKKLRHPSIVHIHPIPWGIRRNPYIARASDISGAPWFCAMEYLVGGALSQIIEAMGRLSLQAAVEVAYQVASALDYVHSKGYAHRDVKPENILLRHVWRRDSLCPPEAVLIDFGISQPALQTSLPAGSLPYIPPERVPMASGMSNLAPAAGAPGDVWGLGVLLYKMLTGQLPFGGRSQATVFSGILNEAPVKPSRYNPEVNAALEAVILRALDKNPQQRPSASEMVMLLDEAVLPPRFAVDSIFWPSWSYQSNEVNT